MKPTWWPNRTGPAQPSPPFSCRLPPLAPKLLGGERWRCPGHLLLPPVSLATPRTLPGLALSPCLLPPFSGSLSPPPSGAPSPPTPFAAATTTLSPPRRLPELRCSALVLLIVSRDHKGPEQPPSPSSSSFGPGAILRQFGHSGAPPSPLTLPTAPR